MIYNSPLGSILCFEHVRSELDFCYFELKNYLMYYTITKFPSGRKVETDNDVGLVTRLCRTLKTLFLAYD